MKILVAVHGFPPTHYAGAELLAERIADWLHRHDHTVEVFAVESVADNAELRVETSQHNGYTIHRLRYNINQDNNRFHNLYDFAPIGRALTSVLERGQFDLLHLISGYLLGGQVIHTAHKYNVPVVITLTEYWFLCARLNLLTANGELCSGPDSDDKCARCLFEDQRRFRLPAKVAPTLMNKFWTMSKDTAFFTEQVTRMAHRRETLHAALDAADLVISPSQFLIDKYGAYGFDTKNYVLIRHGLEHPAARPVRRTDNQSLRLGYLGQIKPHKGIHLLVQAAVNLLASGHNVHLDIWGPDDEASEYVAELKRKTELYSGQIQWHGRYQRSQVWDILAGFDALVMPSCWYENSPTVIWEAFIADTPVIATNLGGMAEMVQHERNGLLFALNDATDLGTQIKRLVTEPGLLDQLRRGIPHVKSADEEIQEIFQRYAQLIDQPYG